MKDDKKDKPIDECFNDLANAIVLQAVDDYKSAYANYLKDKGSYANVCALRKWFHSDWYMTLTKVSGDYLIEKIEQECEEEFERKQRHANHQGKVSKRHHEARSAGHR